jgi:ABC-type transport system involved in multi-copper enzyme maturation permease subunit
MNDSDSPGVSSYLRTMRALLAKDWRFFRAPMIALLVVGPACFLIALIAVFSSHPAEGVIDTTLQCLFIAAMIACALTSLLASAFGGIAIAGERTDRTADFLGLLPVSRTQIILSKWIASISMLLASAGTYLAIAGSSWLIVLCRHPAGPPAMNATPRDTDDLLTSTACWIGFTAAYFGIGWLLSAFTRSGPISACISIATTFAASTVFGLATQAMDERRYSDQDLTLAFASLLLAIGLLSAIGGAIYYRKRIAP